ncbi:response regulator transcription factor [Sporosarcina cascadiensis]|uniref:response regulator transcription factor n=1 Tax=Sporosarcina cascadiensis TaxID=2660747 RepID=UPI00189124C4|nr:helix-turn-helix transcriptional regulator [Sporosarcina cascadiensis]
MRLTKSDYEKIIYIINHSDIQSSNTFQRIQSLLSSLFNFDHSLFWFSDSQFNMYNMQFLNHPDKLILDYTEVYRDEDIMNPKKQSKNIIGKRNIVLSMDSIAENSDYRNSEYINFMNKHKMIDQMVMYFTDEKRILGGIGFTRFEGDAPFNQKDREVLQTLSMHINQLIKNYMAMEEYQAINSFHLTKEHNNLGIIQLSSFQQILFYNEAAQEIINQIEPLKSVESFFQHSILPGIAKDLFTMDKPFSLDIGDWTMKITPNIHMSENPTPIPYSIYMYKINNRKEKNHLLMLLSRREVELYEQVLKGYTNEEISNRLCISINTVKKHLGNIYQKLDVSNRTSLIHKLKNGL